MHRLLPLPLCLVIAGCQLVADPDFVDQCVDYEGTRATGAPAAQAGGWQELPNPMIVPVADREYLWLQLVDTLDDYFDIESERRPQNLGGMLTEGQIETHYVPGATLLEPWRWDSASWYERTLATFQSIRRRASVRVVPQQQGLAVGVTVLKELEDVARPVNETPGSSVPRQDGSLVRLSRNAQEDNRNLGWIPLGRDLDLEQEILYELNRRIVEDRR